MLNMQSDRRSLGNQFAEPGKKQSEMLGENHKNRPPIATTTDCSTWPTPDTTLTVFGAPSVEPSLPGLMLPIISSTTIEPSYDRPQAPVSFQETRSTHKPAKRPRDSTPADEIVVSNGDVFHIRYIDESPIDEDLPSSTGPIVQPDDQWLDEADTSYTYTDEPAGERDWINYDELPMLSKQISAAPASQSEMARANVEACDSGSLCRPLLISAESSGRPETEAILMHNTPALSVESAARCANLSEVSQSQRERHNRRRKHKPTTTGSDSNGGWHDFRNYCVECTKFFPTAEDLELHMECSHRLVLSRASIIPPDDLALFNSTFEPHFDDTPGSRHQTQLSHVPHASEMESFFSDLFQRSANEFR